MMLNAAPLGIECSQQPFAVQLTKCLLGSFSAMYGKRKERSLIYHKLLRSQTFDKKCFPKPHAMRRSFSENAMRRSFSENFDDKKSFHKVHAIRRSRSQNLDVSFFDREGFDDTKENGRGDLHSNEFCINPSSIVRERASNSFLQSSLDILDPIALGIRPEAPNWPERESIRWLRFEQNAKDFSLPSSLKMIQKKIKLHKGYKVLEESASCSVRKALSSVVFIMLELQSSVLKMGEALCHEDLETVINKVQSDTQSSYEWLFRQVFSRTPAFMIYMILLLANFSLHSTALYMALAQAPLLVCETETIQCSSTDDLSITISEDNALYGKEDKLVPGGTWTDFSKSIPHINVNPQEASQHDSPELKSLAEVFLWNSMLDGAKKMQLDQGDVVLHHEVLQRFVSPISVALEGDDYLEYSRTETRYQIELAQEPNNPLLLCNYAQFLMLIVNDPDRAEEYFKKAVEVEPPDAESHCLYAEFLWKVRNDLWGAEERYLEAVAAEPENSHHVSKYAEFLWRTGGEDTCFPLDTSNNNQNDLK